MGRRRVIVLDTHAWVWWAARSPRLSRRARAAIDGEREVGIAAISCWEVAMLVAKGRLELDRDVLTWIRQSLMLPSVTVIELTPEIAVAAADLGRGFPGDPADRLITATAVRNAASLVTADRRIRSSRRVPTIW